MKYKDGGNAAESTINCYGFFMCLRFHHLKITILNFARNPKRHYIYRNIEDNCTITDP